jgi:syntenin-1
VYIVSLEENQSEILKMTCLKVAVRSTGSSQIVAPVTGNDVGLHRAEIRGGVREVILCKDQDGKIGLRVQSVNKVCIFELLWLYGKF